ncbi:MAG TPA: hypothetical protein PLO67_13040 [Saprospiraceae bacterium]|nr:hypothetical protein [Saprospiraceae bacterium]HPI06779.1 hypothetical protein [Saprospiraceae bacterium]
MNSSIIKLFTLCLLLLIKCNIGWCIIKYDEGRVSVMGVQLFQDSEVATDYYYLPQYPSVARKEDGTFEIMCIKYVGKDGPESNGGLFHALIEFSLPVETLAVLEKELKKTVPSGRIAGPVPLLENFRDGEAGLASFEVVSSILSNKSGSRPMTQSVITSGHAPLLPGSKAAVAAKLSQDGATLLWESFQGGTTDVSIAISCYFEAMVKGYNAIVEAEASTVYTHFSQVLNEQEGYSRNQLRDITDKLIQDKVIKVSVFDRSLGLGIKSDDMQAIVDLVTNKLIELMFDSKTGWAQVPATEVAVEQDQMPGRQEAGGFYSFFSGGDDQPYITDHQFSMKRRKDIRINKFYLNLSKTSSIKVPYYTTGNIRGFYNYHKEDTQYFRVVNMDDPDFSKREILFQVDGNFTQAFGDILNFVSVSFKKEYPFDQSPVIKELVIKGSDLAKGADLQSVIYPSLGLSGDALLEYRYRLGWSFKGQEATVHEPISETEWLTGRDAAVTLRPPFDKRVIEIDADRMVFKDADIKSASIRFFAVLNGVPQVQKTLVLRAEDSQNTSKIALYFDKGQPLAYQITWYTKKSSEPQEGKVTEIDDTFLYLLPPGK